MFFYASLFVATLILAAVVLWLYRALMGAGKAVYQTILPSSRSGPADHLGPVVTRTSINETPTPWGWGDNTKPSQAARTAKIDKGNKTPWGWSGNDQKAREPGLASALPNTRTEPAVKPQSKGQVGWPYREEKFEFAGKAYKVTRKSAPKKTNLSTTGKPWGW